MYYNARYYDPEIGQFISPDSIVPDPTNVFAYNRYMYVYGNPLKYKDATGNIPILPFISAGAGAASDYIAQVAMNYYFDPSITTVDEAMASVNGWQVARSGAEGLIPWRIPGGPLGRVAATATGDILAKAASAAYNGQAYSNDHIM